MKVPSTHTQRVRILYKTILKLHRGLPSDLQVMGNIYMQEEFRRHKNCPAHEANTFMNEWTQLGLRGPRPKSSQSKFGAHLKDGMLEDFKDDQILQLYELMKATKNYSEESNTKT